MLNLFFCKAETVLLRFSKLIKVDSEKSDIITKVYDSDFGTPIVCVLKLDRSLRICGYFLVTFKVTNYTSFV